MRTSWPAVCQSLPTVEPTRPAPRTAIFISLLPPSEAVSCRDDELAVGAALFHVGVRPGRRVVAASPRHICAMKALAARTRDIDDLRLLAGIVGVESADAALQICAKRSS